MKKYLIERTISSFWLGSIGYFFVLSFAFFNPKISYILIYIGPIVAFMCALYGFLRGYKTLILSADQIDILPLRYIAGIWVGIFANFGLMWFKDYFKIWQTEKPILFAPIILSACLIGWLFFYRLFLLPKVDYISLFPTLKQRLISALWFGLIGSFLVLSILNSVIIAIFVFLLTAYQGFNTGYRNLLLPRSRKATVKSAMFGFIYSSYALLIVFLMFIASNFPYLSISTFNISEFIEVNIIVIFIIFPIVSLLVGSVGIISSLLFYALFRPKMK